MLFFLSDCFCSVTLKSLEVFLFAKQQTVETLAKPDEPKKFLIRKLGEVGNLFHKILTTATNVTGIEAGNNALCLVLCK